MQRTLNYTGRSKIEKKHALFSFSEDNESIPEFNVAFNFERDQYPENAAVYVEAYYKETTQRFDYGKFGRLTPPSDRRLDQIDLSGPTFFRVMIVDESGRHGMLLASGSQFRADTGDDEGRKSSLLSVRKYDLGQVPWRVYLELGTAPELHLNSGIDNAIGRMTSDPEFRSLILPAALREILTYYLWSDEDAESSEHCARWMAYASMFAEENPDPNDPVDSRQWIEEVVRGFSERFHLLNDLLVKAGAGDDQ